MSAIKHISQAFHLVPQANCQVTGPDVPDDSSDVVQCCQYLFSLSFLVFVNTRTGHARWQQDLFRLWLLCAHSWQDQKPRPISCLQAHQGTLQRSRLLCVPCTASPTTLTTASLSPDQNLKGTLRRLQLRPTPFCYSPPATCRSELFVASAVMTGLLPWAW